MSSIIAQNSRFFVVALLFDNWPEKFAHMETSVFLNRRSTLYHTCCDKGFGWF